MEIPLFATQVDWLKSIASFRNDWLDPFFLFLDYFDSLYFVMALIPIIWIGITPRWGLRVAILLILSALINNFLKDLFHEPRPIMDYPQLAMLPYNTPGFPSGGAQTAALLGGLLVYGWKSKWAWAVALPYALLIGFSRLYLGLHYPTDVLGGYIIGLAILFAFIYSIKDIDRFCKQHGCGFCIILSVVLCFLYGFLMPSESAYRLVAGFLGFCLGAYGSNLFSLNPTKPRPLKTRILSATATVLIVYILYFLTRHLLPPIQAFIIAIWISLAAFPCCRALFPTYERQ